MRLRRFCATQRNEPGTQSRITYLIHPRRHGAAAACVIAATRPAQAGDKRRPPLHGSRANRQVPPQRRPCMGERQMAKSEGWLAAGEGRTVETKPPVPRAILVGVQLPGVDDVAHAASIEELGRLVNTRGYEGVGTISQKPDEIDGATVLGKGRPGGLAASTAG